MVAPAYIPTNNVGGFLFFPTACPVFVICRGGSDGKESAYNAGEQGLMPDQKDPLKKEMAIHSSIPAWEIPWTQEPGGLQSMGSQRVRHN